MTGGVVLCPDFWRALLVPQPLQCAFSVETCCREVCAPLPEELARRSRAPNDQAQTMGRHLIRHLLLGLGPEERKAQTVDGRSLARYALDHAAVWALPALLSLGMDLTHEDPAFPLDLLKRQPSRWKLFRTRGQLGAVVAMRDADGVSALHHVATTGSESGVVALIADGADACARTKTGQTALHFTWSMPTAHAGHAAVTRILVKAGCRWDEADSEGNTPFHLLLKHGMQKWSPNARLPDGPIHLRDAEGVLPLGRVLRQHRAARFDAAHTATLMVWLPELLARGASWQETQADGTTPWNDREAWRSALDAWAAQQVGRDKPFLPALRALDLQMTLAEELKRPAPSCARARF